MKKKTKKILAISIGSILGLVVAFMFLGVLLTGKGFNRSFYPKSDLVKYTSNARQISLLCREYSSYHDGHFPKSLEELKKYSKEKLGYDVEWMEEYLYYENELIWDYTSGLTTSDEGEKVLFKSKKPMKGVWIVARVNNAVTVEKKLLNE